MFQLIKKHYLAIILALIVGSLTALPQIFAAQKVDNFQGIYKDINNDEIYYMARAKDIIDGHSFLSNPYLYEYKDGFPMQFWLPDYILAKPLAILNINLRHGYLLYDFILPAILTLLTYSIVFRLTGSQIFGFLGAVFLHLTNHIYIFNRAPSPQLNFIFWLLLFLFWLRFLDKPNYTNVTLMGIVLGLLFHIYAYYWTFYIIFFALFIGFNFILKRKIEYKKYLQIISLALIISIPYFVSLIQSMQLPYYAESVARVGMIDSHFPSGRKILMWGCIVLLLLYFSYKKRIIRVNAKSLLLLSSVLAPMVAVNQHIITGKNLQFSSHYWLLGVFCFVFTTIYVLNLWFKKIKIRYIKIFILILAGIYMFYGPAIYTAIAITGKAVRYSDREIKQQDYAPIFRWLNDNTLADEVVFTGGELKYLIPVYTANNVFSGGYLHFMPDKEVHERRILNHYWDDFFDESSENYVSHKRLIRGNYYITKYNHELSKNKIRKLFFLPPKKYVEIPQEDINRFLEFAQDIQSKDFEQQVKKYKVDYLIWDRQADPHWQIAELTFLKLVHQINNIAIYKIE